jgi:hypothetical protein
MTRSLRLVSTNPSPVIGPMAVPLPTPRAVSDAIQTEAENIRGRVAWALLPLTSKVSTDVALARSRAELFALATAFQKLARRL